MNNNAIENTLFIGNGFSRSVFDNIPSWSDLFEGISKSITNNTFLYEITQLNSSSDEMEVKSQIIKKINSKFSKENIKSINNINQFGDFLSQHHVNNIITTNYDNGIEFILCQMCGYIEKSIPDMVPESIYSIRTYKMFSNEKLNHRLKLWKIHGDFDRIQSVTLGFDQYCGALSKLNEYVKGDYKSSKQNSESTICSTPMKKKCKHQIFDDISWAELFFKSNVYIVGFGMDFSELDIWWLINKRARFMTEIPEIKNTITYLYDTNYENPGTKPAVFTALEAFKVACHPIKSDPDYIEQIFMSISTNTE